MSLENNYKPMADIENEKKLIDMHFIKNTGLCEDVINGCNKWLADCDVILAG